MVHLFLMHINNLSEMNTMSNIQSRSKIRSLCSSAIEYACPTVQYSTHVQLCSAENFGIDFKLYYKFYRLEWMYLFQCLYLCFHLLDQGVHSKVTRTFMAKQWVSNIFSISADVVDCDLDIVMTSVCLSFSRSVWVMFICNTCVHISTETACWIYFIFGTKYFNEV